MGQPTPRIQVAMKERSNKSIGTIENFSAVAKKQRWQLLYDVVADCLYWSKRDISRNAKLRKLSREVSFYVRPNGSVEGLMIQSFRNNFLTQNQDVAAISDLFTKANDDVLVVTGARAKEAKTIIDGFAESIKKDIFKDALEANYTVRDLDKLLTV